MTLDVPTIWRWLDAVPDPEIPVISVVDLGIVRDVRWADDTLEVAVTPTYSGCPATSVIAMDIETALHDRGVRKVRIKTQIAPAWTTDWLSDKGRAKLRDYGIAPPSPAGGPDGCTRTSGGPGVRSQWFIRASGRTLVTRRSGASGGSGSRASASHQAATA